MIKCAGCGIELLFSTDCMCGVCREDERKDRFNDLAEEQKSLNNKPTLEVFVVRTRKDKFVKMVVILAIDETDAIDLTKDEYQKQGWIDFSISEAIQGPFKRGSILYFNTSLEGKRVPVRSTPATRLIK